MNAELMSYKYDYEAKQSFGVFMTKKKLFFLILAFVALPVIVIFTNFYCIIGWLIFVVAVPFINMTSKRIILTPRYVLCGDEIVYYANISAIKLNNRSGKMFISCKDIKTNMVIKRDSFPTNANKSHKIINNKNKKFKKVSEKIIHKTKQLNSNASIEVEGFIVVNENL